MEGLIQRAVEPWARELLATVPILTIEGARQTGKSTLAAMLTQNTDALTLSLDERDSRVFAEQDPKAFVEQAAGRLLVIDEIQRVPSLTLAVKASVEQNRTPGRFILTGSSDLARLRGDKDSLAGRTVNLGLFPFTQAELRATTARGTLVDRILDATEPREATTPQTP